jgi:hypothetical protein
MLMLWSISRELENPMRVLEVKRDEASVCLTKTELMILNNALNEVCNGIEVPEFTTRLGADISEVRQLLGDVDELLGHHLFGQPRLP